jgi:hypothetical protein
VVYLRQIMSDNGNTIRNILAFAFQFQFNLFSVVRTCVAQQWQDTASCLFCFKASFHVKSRRQKRRFLASRTKVGQCQGRSFAHFFESQVNNVS